MRTIKFRVWDHDEERFIEWFNPDPMLSCKDGELWCYERRGYDENGNFIQGDDLTHTSISKRNLVLQQFTGLLDKNNKEIYEGDLVKGLFKDTDYMNWEIITSEVVWVDRVAGFNLSSELWDKTNIEVVGNIFEK
jgi:uncharacterized phage protein (TIGR01671 family)